MKRLDTVIDLILLGLICCMVLVPFLVVSLEGGAL